MSGQESLDGVGSRSARVQSVTRAVALLRAVVLADAAGSSVGTLAEACGLNRATAWRLLVTLETEGLVVSDRATGRWSPGLGLAELAGDRAGDALVRAAAPVLDRLAADTGETAALAVLRGDGLTYVAEAVPASVVAASWQGRTVPLHATSTGKALLAFVSAERRAALLGSHPLERFTPATIADPAALAAELDRTRERGFGVCAGEYDAAAYGVSAPVLGRLGDVLGLVSIWGPAHRLTPDRFATLGPLAVRAATEIVGG